MPTNTIEHPTWAETEYENLSRREAHASIIVQLAAAFVIFGLIIFALATLRDVARHIRKRNAKPAPVVEARPLPPMYDLDRYLQSVGGREAECVPVKKAGQQ